MRRYSGWALASVVTLAVTGLGAASAADMAVKARPVIVEPGYNWSGFYIGGNLGGGFADGHYTLSPDGCFLTGLCGGAITNNPLRTFTVNNSNTFFIGGAQAGYNWQAGKWVFGLEGDINYNGWNQNSNNIYTLVAPLAGTFTSAVNTKLNWFGTVRGRVGVAVSPALMIFGTGGLAYGQVSSSTLGAFSIGVADTYAGTASSTRAGWTVGGGGEWFFAPNWSAKAEYLYVDLGKLNYADGCASPAAFCTGFVPAPAYATSVQFREHVARVGINYHFNGPVVAKY